jgi:aminopeptidase
VIGAEHIPRLAELIVCFGANVQPGQIVAISSEPGKEPVARAVAEAAYRQGAKFVDGWVFDMYFKRARAQYADPDSLSFVPSWYGERWRALVEQRGAWISLHGPAAPHAMEGIDPALAGMDILPRLAEANRVVNERMNNWTVAPCPTAAWAALTHPDLASDEAFEQLWREVAHVCRLGDSDPVAAWRTRLDRLLELARKLDDLRLGSIRFEGPGTELDVGLLRTSRWQAAYLTTVEGIRHLGNIPTEEVFTTPDPDRVSGFVSATKPLVVAGGVVEGLRVRFEAGRAVAIDADRGAETLWAMTGRDPGGTRLGEVALVDRESRVGQLQTIFYDTLLDENAASHIALGNGLRFAVEDDDDLARVNASEIHVDFMIGSDDVAVFGTTADGAEVSLLHGGRWQL